MKRIILAGSFILFLTFMALFLLAACGQSGTSGSSVSFVTTAATLKVTGVNPYSIDQAAESQAVAQSVVESYAFPNDAQFNCTFSSFKFSPDGINYSDNILSSPLTVDLFSNVVRSATGTTVVISVISSETVAYVKMAVSAITLTASGQTTRDILTEMKSAYPTEDFDNMVMEILPFVYSGGAIRMNVFVARPQSSTDFASWDIEDANPSFTFFGPGIEQSAVGTVNITVEGATLGSYLYAQAYRNRDEGTAPSFTAAFPNPATTRAADSKIVATGTITLPAGSFYIAASASNKPLTSESVTTFESTEWTLNGVNRGDSLITVEAEEACYIILTPESSSSSSQEIAQNNATIQIAITSEAVMSLGGQGEFLLFTATSELGVLDSTLRDTPFMETIEAQTFQHGVVTAPYLDAGTYYMILFLDVDNDRIMDYNVDYWYRNPNPVTLTSELTTVIPTDEAWELELFTPGL